MPRFIVPYSVPPGLDPVNGSSSEGQKGYRPTLVVRLHGRNGLSLQCIAIADSGAGHCAFPLKFALELGLETSEMRKGLIGGVGTAKSTVYYGKVRLELVDQKQEREIEAGFTTGLDKIGFGLLGHTGFFDEYVVTFDSRHKVFYLDTV